MTEHIKTIEHMRAEYHLKDAHDRSEYMEQIGPALRKHRIDPWLIMCPEAHWKYIKKIETVQEFTNA